MVQLKEYLRKPQSVVYVWFDIDKYHIRLNSLGLRLEKPGPDLWFLLSWVQRGPGSRFILQRLYYNLQRIFKAGALSALNIY